MNDEINNEVGQLPTSFKQNDCRGNMIGFWNSFSTDWKRRFAEHSTLKGNSLMFEVSEEQKEYMESLGTLMDDMYNPKSVTFETVDNCIICTATYDDLSWMGMPGDDEKELGEYLQELHTTNP